MIIRKDVLQLTGPIIAEQTFIMLMGVINAIMAGHLGKEVVSAIGMVDSINNIFIAFFSALAIGGTVVVAQYKGQNNYKDANEAVRHTMFSALFLSAIITIILFIFKEQLLNALFGGAELSVINNSFTYMIITLPTYPLIAATSVAYGVLRGVGDTKTPMKISIIMNALNIILSYILIYGLKVVNNHFSITIPAFGIRGAAYGIAAARTIGAALVIFTLLRGSKLVRLTINRSFKLNIQMLKSIFGIGIPASIESLLFNGGKLITQIYIVGFGTASIAANYIVSSVFGIINIPAGAMSIAATTFVGFYMGRNDTDEAKNVLMYLTKAATISLFVLGAIAFPFSKFLVSIYNTNSDVISISTTLLKTSLIAMPFLWAFSFIIPAGLKGAGDAKYTMYVSIFGMWVFRITLGYILGIPLKLGIIGVWAGMYIDWLVRGILFYRRLHLGKWKNNVIINNLEQVS